MSEIITNNTGEYEEFARLSNTLSALNLDIVLAEEEDTNEVLHGIKKFASTAIVSEKRKSAIAEKIRVISDSPDFAKADWTNYMEAIVGYRNPQSYGPLAEKLWILKGGYQKVSSSDAKGDYYNPTTGEYTEFKFSAFNTTFSRPNIDLVQLRPHHTNNNYHIVVYDKEARENHLFVLTKEEMAREIELNPKRAHGRKTDQATKRTEYAIRFKYEDETWKRWSEKYKQPFPY